MTQNSIQNPNTIINTSLNSSSQAANIQTLSSFDLLQRMERLVRSERKITHLILECINEIEVRKLHLKNGYSSMFDFLTQNLGYTPASAQRRLESARLIRQMPIAVKENIIQKIEAGALQLSQISMVQKYSREKSKQTGSNVSIEQKQNILFDISNKTLAESEVIITKSLDVPTPVSSGSGSKSRHHQDESVTLTMTLSKEELEIIAKVRDMKTLATGSLEVKDLLVYLAKRELKRKSQVRTVHEAAARAGKETCAAAPRPTCQFRDPISKKVCGTSQFLTVDHIQPRWAGGSDEASNLRVLCKNHNMYRYKIQAGTASLPVRK